MTHSASPPQGDAPDSPLSRLPEEARAERADLLDHLAAVLQPEERLDVVAGADSPDAGIIALTNRRLLYVHLSETRQRFKLRQELRCATFARSDLRGARSDDRGLTVLCHKHPPLRFRNFVPAEACDLLASALGAPPIDQWTAELDECSAGSDLR